MEICWTLFPSGWEKKSVIVNMFCLMPQLSGESFLNMGDKFSEAARMEACADNLASK